MHMLMDMTREEIRSIAPDATVVLPVGAVEQHGYHLPVSTDVLLVERIAVLSAELAGLEIPLVLAPTQPFGFSHHHFLYPGAMSLPTDLLQKVLVELVESLIRSGFHRIFILNGHGGNEECVRIAARMAALQHPVLAGAGSYWTMAWDDMREYGLQQGLYGMPGHAGAFETSMMLAVRPDLVHMDRVPVRQGHEAGPPGKGLLERPRIEHHASWSRIDGYSDEPLKGETRHGTALLKIISKAVASEFITFHHKL
ncbi:creatininase family protein [Paenibacillus solisilvae]|uniref:Creatininase family protein n=1 Tax=Paenibacillus solisilvae TaxID=2486751 RepID=A0ABW0VXF0_9BACL